MAGLLPGRDQFDRVWRTFSETRERTGSLVLAAGHTGWFVAVKVPKLMDRLRHRARHTRMRRQIALAMERGAPAEPLLGLRVSGGLGDYLVIARFLRDLAAVAGPFRFDIYSGNEERARWVFGALDGMRDWYHEVLFEDAHPAYDLAMRLSQFVLVQDATVRWQRLAERPGLAEAARAAMRFRPQIAPFIEHHPRLDGFLAQKAIYANRRRADFLHAMAGIPYSTDRLGIAAAPREAERRGLQPGCYLTVHNGFDPDFFTGNRPATKCYPHFGAVLALLRKRWPALRFVQIGTHTSRPIEGVDLALVGGTTLAEAAGLIAGAALHLDNEGGLVHLARCLGVSCCVVFGPTPSAYFGYDANINLDPPFCGGCWWINETWMSQCPRGFETARCMTEQPPEVVAAAIDARLRVAARGAGAGLAPGRGDLAGRGDPAGRGEQAARLCLAENAAPVVLPNPA